MPFDGTELSTVTKILIQAKAYMEEHGWGQILLEDEKGKVCILGAIQKVIAPHVSVPLGHPFLATVVCFHEANQLVGDVTTWNDSSWRRREEVMVAFDKAITYSMSNRYLYFQDLTL